MISIIVEILVGALVGWLAGIIMKCQGSWLRNIVIGVLAGAISGWLFGAHGWLLGTALTVAVACGLIWLAKKLFK